MMDAEEGSEDGFIMASASSKWYQNLNREGSCLKLLELLKKDAQLIRQMGAQDVTVLHKGVRQGCVTLVKYILADVLDEGNRQRFGIRLTREDLLRKTTADGATPVAIAIMTGSPKMMMLLRWATELINPEIIKQVTEQVPVRTCSLFTRKDPIVNNVVGYFEDDSSSVRTEITISPEDDASSVRASISSEDGGGSAEGLVQNEDDGPELDELQHIDNKSWPGLGENMSVMAVMDPSDEDGSESGKSNGMPVAQTSGSIRLNEAVGTLVLPNELKVNMWLDRPPAPNVEDGEIGDEVYDCRQECYDLIHGEEPIFVSWKESLQDHCTQLYDIIRSVLNSSINHHTGLRFWKAKCKSDVDFEFVPVEQVLLHCIFTGKFTIGIMRRIVLQIIDMCIASGTGGTGLLRTLFNLHDPQGRTFLHVALEYENYGGLYELVDVMNQAELDGEFIRYCMNVRDGAGRTILHALCNAPENAIDHWRFERILPLLDFNARISPANLKEWTVLAKWSFPNLNIDDYIKKNRCTPLHLAVICNSQASVKKLLRSQCDVYAVLGDPKVQLHAMQIATLLGRTKVLELLLQFKKPSNIRFWNEDCLPMIHCAAISGHVETIRAILKYPIFDPLMQTKDLGTALHVIVKLQKIQDHEVLEALAIIHTLPSAYKAFRKQKMKSNPCEDQPRMYTATEMSCINLLLQSGIDIWTPHAETKEIPSPGPMANDDAIKWWYDKVISEVVTVKTSIGYAANATSVIAALIATASFIGPFQPPLGYAASDGYIHINRLPVQVYLVSNSLSFFFSVASLLMAVVPAIPMPKESLYDELRRSERSLRVAAFMLLISIFCVLTSFSAASIAVVPSDWYERRLVAFSILVGGGVCFSVIVIYIIRLLRLFFHANARFRRRFAKYMFF